MPRETRGAPRERWSSVTTEARTALRIALGCWLVYLLFLDPYPASMATDLIGLGVAMANGEVTLPEGMRAEFAHRAGRYYSGLPPGGSVPVTAIYALARPLLPDDPATLLVALNVLATILVSAPFAALGPAALYLCVRRLGVAPRVALESALLVAFATTNFGYATGYFKENLATSLVVGAFAALLWTRAAGPPAIAPFVVAGLAVGAAMSLVYASLLPAVVLGLYALARGGFARGVVMALSAVPPVAAVLWYHQAAFGSPFATGYTYKAWITPHASWFGATDFGRLIGMAVSPGYGLFVFAPVLAFGLAGLVRLVRAPGPWRAEAACCLGVFVLTWVVYGHYRVPVDFWIPLPHDMGLTTRYLGITAPFLMVGFALTRSAWPGAAVRVAALTTLAFGYLSAVPGLNPTFVAPLIYAVKVTVSTFGAGMLFGDFLPDALGVETFHTVVRRPDVAVGDVLAGPTSVLVRLVLAQLAFAATFVLAATVVAVALTRLWDVRHQEAAA